MSTKSGMKKILLALPSDLILDLDQIALDVRRGGAETSSRTEVIQGILFAIARDSNIKWENARDDIPGFLAGYLKKEYNDPNQTDLVD